MDMKFLKKSWFFNILLSFALLLMIVYTVIILPSWKSKQQLESYRAELYNTMQIGMDLCGDRINREDTVIFNGTRDKFLVHQGALLNQYNIVYDDMSVYAEPDVLLLLGEYCSIRDLPMNYAAYAADSDNTTGQFIYLCTNIIYDALGEDSQNMQDVLNEIKSDVRLDKAVALIK